MLARPASHHWAAAVAGPRSAARLGLTVGACRRRHRRQAAVAPAAAASLGPPALPIVKATGVPLVEALMALPSLEAAARHSLRLAALAAAGAALGCLLLELVDRHVGERLEARATFNVLAAAAVAALQPAEALLPYYAASYCAAVAAALAQVAATRMGRLQFAGLCFGRGEELLRGTQLLAQFLHDTSELVLIVFAAWAAIRLKDRLMRWLAWGLAADKARGREFAAGLLAPASGVLTCGILLLAGATALAAYGIDVGPLLTSLGGFSVAVGLAVQSLSTNLVSSLGLLAGRPFVIGDRVQLLARGSPVVTGVVETMGPLRIVVRDEDGNPVYLSNNEVAGCNVRNLTQGDAHRARLPPSAM